MLFSRNIGQHGRNDKCKNLWKISNNVDRKLGVILVNRSNIEDIDNKIFLKMIGRIGETREEHALWNI